MIIGRGTVVGEWITVFSEALVLLSKIEGYQGALATEDCSYIRELFYWGSGDSHMANGYD